MAGNSQRRGAMRKPGTKKGAVAGSGGQKSKGLQGRKATPPAEQRPGHPAARRAAARAEGARSQLRNRRNDTEASETVLGRNPVLECLRAGVPATALHVALGIDADDRVTDAIRFAADAGISILEVPRGDLDRIAGGALHQGIALQVPPYAYAHPEDVLAAAQGSGTPPLLVALDGVTDPRNLGAVIRSAAAFGAHGVVIPTRRTASMSGAAWKASAGAAVRIRIAQASNLVSALRAYKAEGIFVVGLDADGETPVAALELATGPLVLVVGAEGAGLSRLVSETCDLLAGVPMARDVESLNAGVATGIALYEIAKLRGTL